MIGSWLFVCTGVALRGDDDDAADDGGSGVVVMAMVGLAPGDKEKLVHRAMSRKARKIRMSWWIVLVMGGVVCRVLFRF